MEFIAPVSPIFVPLWLYELLYRLPLRFCVWFCWGVVLCLLLFGFGSVLPRNLAGNSILNRQGDLCKTCTHSASTSAKSGTSAPQALLEALARAYASSWAGRAQSKKLRQSVGQASKQPLGRCTNFTQAVRQPNCNWAVALRKSVHMQDTNARIEKVDEGTLQFSRARWPMWCVSSPSSTCWMPLAKKHP